MKCVIDNGYILAITNETGNQSDTDLVNAVKAAMQFRPTNPDGYTYKLRADNLEWELVELPPVEPEATTDEEALTRYANALTGANDTDLISAAETLITERIKEEP